MYVRASFRVLLCFFVFCSLLIVLFFGCVFAQCGANESLALKWPSVLRLFAMAYAVRDRRLLQITTGGKPPYDPKPLKSETIADYQAVLDSMVHCICCFCARFVVVWCFTLSKRMLPLNCVLQTKITVKEQHFPQVCLCAVCCVFFALSLIFFCCFQEARAWLLFVVEQLATPTSVPSVPVSPPPVVPALPSPPPVAASAAVGVLAVPAVAATSAAVPVSVFACGHAGAKTKPEHKQPAFPDALRVPFRPEPLQELFAMDLSTDHDRNDTLSPSHSHDEHTDHADLHNHSHIDTDTDNDTDLELPAAAPMECELAVPEPEGDDDSVFGRFDRCHPPFSFSR